MTQMTYFRRSRKSLRHAYKRDFVSNNACNGFTLVEAVIVIVITGIVAGMVAVFIKAPVDAYFDTQRRAELTDIADTTLRRMARDIHRALPNSVRVSGNYLEFIPLKGAGRYRAEAGTAAGDDPLDFDLAADSFDVLGPAVPLAATGDSVVIYNLGISGSDAYEATSRRAATPSGAKISFTGGPFPLASPGSRFQVVGTAATYECAPDPVTPANGFLRRYSGYAIQAVQPAPPGGTPAILASNVTACSMEYTSGVLQRQGLVSIRLAISRDGETVTLQHQVNVDNTP